MSASYTLVPVPLDTYNTCTYGHAIMYNSIINMTKNTHTFTSREYQTKVVDAAINFQFIGCSDSVMERLEQ